MNKIQNSWVSLYQKVLTQAEIALRFDSVYVVPDSFSTSLSQLAIQWKEKAENLRQFRQQRMSSLSNSQLKQLDSILDIYFSIIFPEVQNMLYQRISTRDFREMLKKASSFDQTLGRIQQILCL